MRDSWVISRLLPAAGVIAVLAVALALWTGANPGRGEARIPQATAPLNLDTEAGLAEMAFDEVVDYLAAHQSHGERDNGLSSGERAQMLLDGRHVVCWCNQAVEPANRVLQALGYRTRLVALLGFEREDRGVFAGHHVIEAWHPDLNRWVIVDIDVGVMLDQSATELPERQTVLRRIDDENRDVALWYRQVGGIVGIRDGEGWPMFDPTGLTAWEVAHAEAHNWIAVDDFDQQFYNTET